MTGNTTKTEKYAHGTETTIQIVACWCPVCGVAYGMAKQHRDRRREDHQTFYCTNGCSLHFSEGSSKAEKEAARLQQELERTQRQLGWAREDRDAQRERRLLAERQRAAAKGQVTKIKNRVAAGVCPCCNRTFQNLARHIAGQHPDFAGGAQ